ncbi:FMN-binding protein [Neobacillus pocheonensis]|uniref:FMN-binding protein n=1 Tax=Neobacillus pocheonensis TaxID=363869 RepID=A0ABT0WF92_9BACI|nr:FMN-binding protein [Neobacillus pocheonensis]
MAKMDKKWVILCSTAVAAVYATGFFSTEAQAIKMDGAPQPQISLQTKVQPSSMSPAKTNEVNGNKTNVASSAISNQPKQMYKDGTFTGTGMNRRGEIKVAVTLKKDKITDVQISNWGMHYSESDVVGLPGEVLQRQNANVDNVSGATYSTQAFADAVQDALNQAKIPKEER